MVLPEIHSSIGISWCLPYHLLAHKVGASLVAVTDRPRGTSNNIANPSAIQRLLAARALRRKCTNDAVVLTWQVRYHHETPKGSVSRVHQRNCTIKDAIIIM